MKKLCFISASSSGRTSHDYGDDEWIFRRDVSRSLVSEERQKFDIRSYGAAAWTLLARTEIMDLAWSSRHALLTRPTGAASAAEEEGRTPSRL